ncbi:hypothetical protein AMTRI_Chr10g4210 [Amborella trichopoda]
MFGQLQNENILFSKLQEAHPLVFFFQVTLCSVKLTPNSWIICPCKRKVAVRNSNYWTALWLPSLPYRTAPFFSLVLSLPSRSRSRSPHFSHSIFNLAEAQASQTTIESEPFDSVRTMFLRI